jgi:predicted phage terminase large subunit-like protein
VKLSRRFVLYVSETQDQADLHVQAIATLFERLGVERAVGRYGTSKGWRRDQIRTANGFNVAAYGLDVAARGVKLDAYRPDLIVFDDIDHQEDSPATVEKKIRALTSAVIPTGGPDCAVLGIQNLVHEEGIFARLVDGRADFLLNREIPVPEPAVRGLKVETTPREDDPTINTYRITAGEPTWSGQDLQVCQGQINEWGLATFLREAQHEVAGASGTFFDVTKIKYIEPHEVPADLRLCRAWDLAGTENGGDWTVGPLMGARGALPDLSVYVIDVVRERWGTQKVRNKIRECRRNDPAGTVLRLPQDPGQAGKDQAEQFIEEFGEQSVVIMPVSGAKSVRARGFQECLNKGNVYFVKAPWNHPVREVLRKFRDRVDNQQDDDVDALAEGYNELMNGEGNPLAGLFHGAIVRDKWAGGAR